LAISEVNVIVITIFGSFYQYSARKYWLFKTNAMTFSFISKTNVMNIFFCIHGCNYSPNILGENHFKNHNIGPQMSSI
jgi:hypothetical protein